MNGLLQSTSWCTILRCVGAKRRKPFVLGPLASRRSLSYTQGACWTFYRVYTIEFASLGRSKSFGSSSVFTVDSTVCLGAAVLL